MKLIEIKMETGSTPEEIEKINPSKAVKRIDKTEVIVGSSESMSKSKKNTIDPEAMINKTGLTLLGGLSYLIVHLRKMFNGQTRVFLQQINFYKIWNLNFMIINRKNLVSDDKIELKFKNKIDSYVRKIDNSISGFKFNVAIANFYEVYNFISEHIDKKIDNKSLKSSITNIMKLLIPLTPHLAYECLEKLGAENINSWPEVKFNQNEEIKIAIQINGKTRSVIDIIKDTSEKEINKLILKDPKLKNTSETKVIKTIFVKNKIINYIIK